MSRVFPIACDANRDEMREIWIVVRERDAAVAQHSKIELFTRESCPKCAISPRTLRRIDEIVMRFSSVTYQLRRSLPTFFGHTRCIRFNERGASLARVFAGANQP
jgi:hypothetical protein